MQLLSTNIGVDGKLVGKHERLSLVEEDGSLDGAKLTESTKYVETKGGKNGEVGSNQSYSPPSA